MKVEFFAANDPRHALAVRLRFTVFVDEQGIPADIELDAFDRPESTAVHALVRDDGGEAIATGRWFARDVETAQIGRMVVLAPARGRGIGALLLHALVADAQRCGYARAVLDAQDHAVGFYARAGFLPYGPMHDDGGIAHQPMQRDL